MNATLSRYEFRAHRKATGAFWLHLRTHVLFETNTSFSVEAYIRNIVGALRLPTGDGYDLDGIEIDAWPALPYDGQRLVHGLHVVVPTDHVELNPAVGHLDLLFEFDFHGAEMEAKISHPVLIRRMWSPSPIRGRRR
jgi:hypothetical protein